ncbi:MAG: type II toxin-antitoxin system RelE/ParE family toxin [Bacteroidota bacterium]
MTVQFDRSFEKSLRYIHDKGLLLRLKRAILQIENASSLTELPVIKKLTGFNSFYRIRIGDYRIGLEIINKNTIRFIIIAHRKDIYKIFP